MERLGKISVKGQERWNVSLDFRSEMVRAVISLVSTRKCQVGKKYGVCAHENITWGVFKDHLLKLHAQITGKRRRAGSARAMVMNYHFPSVLMAIFKRHSEFVTVTSKNGSDIYSDLDLFALTGEALDENERVLHLIFDAVVKVMIEQEGQLKDHYKQHLLGQLAELD